MLPFVAFFLLWFLLRRDALQWIEAYHLIPQEPSGPKVALSGSLRTLWALTWPRVVPIEPLIQWFPKNPQALSPHCGTSLSFSTCCFFPSSVFSEPATRLQVSQGVADIWLDPNLWNRCNEKKHACDLSKQTCKTACRMQYQSKKKHRTSSRIVRLRWEPTPSPPSRTRSQGTPEQESNPKGARQSKSHNA